MDHLKGNLGGKEGSEGIFGTQGSENGCFEEECRACLREAEEAEEKEIRSMTDRKMAAGADEDALRLPADVAENILLVSTEAGIQEVEERYLQADLPYVMIL